MHGGQFPFEIVNVGFRYTTVRTTEGHRVHIPNSFLTQNVVHTIANREEGPAGINLKVQLGYSFRPERAREILLAALRDEPGIAADPAPSVRVDEFLESGIQYNLRFFLEVSKEAVSPVISSHPSILTGLSEALERRLEMIAAARRERAGDVEPPLPKDAILRKLVRFFRIT